MRKISVLLATLAGTAVLCAACGGSGLTASTGTHPSSADPNTGSAGSLGSLGSLGSSGTGSSEPNPCKVVPLAEVRSVVGSTYGSGLQVGDICTYISDANAAVVEIDLLPLAYSSATSASYTAELMQGGGKLTPFNGLGHPAECGTSAVGPTLLGAVGSSSVVVVVGPSCGADGKLAQDVYSALAS